MFYKDSMSFNNDTKRRLTNLPIAEARDFTFAFGK